MQRFANAIPLAILASLVFGSSVVCAADQVGRHVTLTDPSGLTAAVQQGDPVAVRRLLDQLNAPPSVRRLSEATVDADIGQIRANAKECRDIAMKAGAPQAAVQCDVYLLGASKSLGDAASWAEAGDWMQHTGIGALQAKLGVSNLDVLGPLSSIDFKSAMDKAAPVSVVGTGKPFTLPLSLLSARAASSGRYPVVSITLNGKPLRAVVDTGFSGTIMVNENAARAIGLTPITGKFHSLISPYARGGLQSEETMALAKSVEFGTLRISQYMVQTTDSIMPFDAVIGADFLYRLKTFDLSMGKLIVGRPVICKEPVHVLFQSDPQLNARLLFTGTVNGRPANISIDTGATEQMIVTSLLYKQLHASLPPPQSLPGRVSGAMGVFRTTRGSVRLGIAGVVYPVDALFLVDSPATADAYLGGGFLAEHRIAIDLPNKKVCLGT
jgi:predicted aspartyl protease